MKVVVSLLAVLVALFGAISASDVLNLSDENFDASIAANPALLVEFYAPWCGHCKSLAPKYELAATQLKGIAPIAKVDCTEQEELCQRFGIRGYPTLKIFRDGKPSDYQGAREVDALVGFVKKQILPAVSVVDAAKAKEFIEAERVVIVGFFESQEAAEFKTFSEVANSLRDDFVFVATFGEDAAKEFEVEVPEVVLFKKFDERKNVYDEVFSKAALSAFVKTNAIPTMDEIGPQNYQKFMDSGLPLAYLFVTPEDRSTVGPIVEAAAKEFKGKVNFVYIDANQFGGHASNLNLKVGEWPSFSIHKTKENTKFPFTGEITTEAIVAHTNGVLSGDLSPSVKSQPIPAEQGNVKVVVGKNYEEIVNSGKDVLIEFYAPWCGHCKKLSPVFDEVGDAFANEENIVIAKMDATENDLPANAPFQIQGFPTIKFIKGDGTILDYNGDRTLEDFKKFVTANASKKLSTEKVNKDEL